MTGEMVLVAVLVAAGGWAYAHFSGRAFDRKYPRPVKPAAPQEHQASGH